jgi:hypothetical protein
MAIAVAFIEFVTNLVMMAVEVAVYRQLGVRRRNSANAAKIGNSRGRRHRDSQF